MILIPYRSKKSYLQQNVIVAVAKSAREAQIVMRAGAREHPFLGGQSDATEFITRDPLKLI